MTEALAARPAQAFTPALKGGALARNPVAVQPAALQRSSAAACWCSVAGLHPVPFPHHDRRAGQVKQSADVVRDRIVDQIRRLHDAQDFLDHALACAHPVVSTCTECSSFATKAADARQSELAAHH